MKYKDSKSGISFLEVSEIGAEIPGGPLGISNTYHKNGDTIESIDEDGKVINAVDIDWNGAEVGDGVYLHTTGEVLNWIKTGKGSSGDSTAIQIDSETKVDTANLHLIHTMVIDGLPISIYQDTSLGGGAKNLLYVDETNLNSHSKIGTLQYGTQTINLYQDKTGSGGSSVVYSPNKTSGDLLGTILINGAANPIYSDKFEDKIGDLVVVTPKGNGTLEVATIKVGNKTESIKVPAAAIDPNPTNPNVGTSIEFSNLRASGTRIASVSLNGKAPFDLLAPVSEDSGLKLQSIDATATVDNTSGTPSVTVAKGGTESNPVFAFNFKGLKGATGAKGEKGDTGAKGDKGDKGDPGVYDDSELRNAINKNTADLNALLNQFDQRVTNAVENALDDAALIEKLFPDGGGGYSNFGEALDSAMDEYLQVIGAWEMNPTTGQKEYKWSKIEQGLQSLETTVGELLLNSGGTGGTTLTSTQLLNINDIDGIKTAVNELSSNYAEFEGTDAKNLKVVRWLSSALGLYANESATWSDLASATENKTTGESAIAALLTRVSSLEDGLISDASLSTLVQDKVNELTASAGFVTTSSLSKTLGDYATATLYATLEGRVSDAEDAAENAAAGVLTSAKYVTDETGNVVVDANGKKLIEGTAKIWADLIEISAQHLLNLSAQEINLTTDAISLSNGNGGLVGAFATQDGIGVGLFANGQPIYGSTVTYISSDSISSAAVSLNGYGYSLSGQNGLNLTLRVGGLGAYDLKIDLSGISISNPDLNLSNFTCDWQSFAQHMSAPVGGGSTTTYEDWDMVIAPDELISFSTGYNTMSSIRNDNGAMELSSGLGITLDGIGVGVSAGLFRVTSATIEIGGSNTSSITASKEISVSSDERLKTISKTIDADISQIANTRVVDFIYNDDESNTQYLGSIAQDWEGIFPNAVKEDSNGNKGLSYGSVALASAVTAAREIVSLKKENESLKSRVEALEKKIEALVNALN